jgi:hypothetical protein
MKNNICTPFEWVLQRRRSKRRIDNNFDALLMRLFGIMFEIADFARRIQGRLNPTYISFLILIINVNDWYLATFRFL